MADKLVDHPATPYAPQTLRLVLRPGEAVDIEGKITLIAASNRKADLVFKGDAKIGKRYRP